MGLLDRVYSIHFAATALLHVDKTATAGEQVICGFEALLAIGMDLNEKFQKTIQAYVN